MNESMSKEEHSNFSLKIRPLADKEVNCPKEKSSQNRIGKHFLVQKYKVPFDYIIKSF